MPNVAARPRVPLALADEAQHRRMIAEATNRLLEGKSSNTVVLTLAASATSTILVDSRISGMTCIALMPQTPDAAAALGSISIVCANGRAVLSHASATSTDRTFTAALIG